MIGNRSSLRVAVAGVLSLAIVGAANAQFDALRKITGVEDATKTIAHFEVKGALTETPVNMPPLFGQEPPLALKSLLARLKDARHDNDVVAIVVDLQNAALGLAQLEEIHAELRKFTAVDKDVFVHADVLTTVTYAAATGASHISVVPTGDLWLMGLYGETPYVRGALDKLGIAPDFEQCGDFKAAAEPLMRTGPSEQSKQMTKWLIDGLYEGLVNVIAEGRAVPSENVRGWIDRGPYSAEEALKAGLIDSVQHRQDFIAELKGRYGPTVKIATDYGEAEEQDLPQDFFSMFQRIMEILNPSPKRFADPTVGLVYVEGTIMPGEAERTPFGTAAGAFSTDIRKALDKAAGEPAVKAVVMRVDSPGGSALASEIILDAARRVAAKKPLVVSMGNVAGSGGYYVTCAAETIFADPSTITASIGVIGGKLVTTDAWNKLGVNWHAEQRGEMAALLSSATPFSDQERAKIRHYMENVYGIFKGHVTAARGDRLAKPIDDLAGGRVFTGAQALDLGLVDKLGGLDDAIKFAVKQARLGDYDIRVIPEPPSIFDLLMAHDEGDEFLGTSRATSSFADLPLFRAILPGIAQLDPLRVRALVRTLQRVELIHEDGVVMMMPAEFVIR